MPDIPLNPMHAAIEAESTRQVFDWLWCSGQLSENDIAKLPEFGIDAVINLAPPTAGNALPGEAEAITRLGIAYIQIPVDWERPEFEQLHQFFGVLKAFDGGNVWVHCAKNKRASVFIYLYRRVSRAENEERASYPMREIWEPNPVWRTFIDDVLGTA